MTKSDIFGSQDSQSNGEGEEEVKNQYIDRLIKRIHANNPDSDEKTIYKLLVKKSKFYYDECVAMKEDPLWEKITERAENYKEEGEDIGISESASFMCAFRAYKPLIMEMISNIINPNENESMETENEDDDQQDESGEVNMINEATHNQLGGNMLANTVDRRSNVFCKGNRRFGVFR